MREIFIQGLSLPSGVHIWWDPELLPQKREGPVFVPSPGIREDWDTPKQNEWGRVRINGGGES